MIRRLLPRASLLAFALLAGAKGAHAQTSQWSAQLFVRSTPSAFFADWERNPQFATLTVSYTGTASTEYTLAAEVKGARHGVISRSTSGPYHIVLGPSTQIISSSQLACFTAENVQAFVDQIARSGTIPEDQYQLQVKVLDDAGKQVAVATSIFTIALPDPPRLTFPANGADVNTSQPMLQWMPVQVPLEIGISYSLRLVEVLAQQTPDVAMRANPVIYETTVTGTTHLLYPIDALPLEEGHRYAWQVEALDGEGHPITSSRRRSELWSFTRTSALPTGLIASTVPDTAILVPGVARLIGLRRATAQAANGDIIRLNGDATLEFMGPLTGSSRVQLESIEVDRSAADVAVTAGSLSGSLTMLMPGAPAIELRRVTYNPSAGVRVSARVHVPGHDAVELDGDIELTPGGAYGVLSTPSNFRGWQLSSGAVALNVNAIRVSLPEAEVTLKGSLTAFGQRVCDDVLMTLAADGTAASTIACPLDTALPMVAGANAPLLRLRRLDGSVRMTATTLTAALTASADLQLTQNGSCTAGVELALDASGAHSTRIEPACPEGDAIRFGQFDLKPSNLAVSTLTYQPANGFQFALQFDGQLGARDGSMALPAFTGITTTQASMQFPALSGPVTGSLVVAGFDLEARTAHAQPFTLSWSDWPAAAAIPRLFFDGSIAFGKLDPSAPACLAESFPAAIRITADEVSAAITEKELPAGCTHALGGGTELTLRRIAGGLLAHTGATTTVEVYPGIIADLTLPKYFTCTTPVSLGGNRLNVDATGSITGRVNGVQVQCPIELPAVRLEMTNVALNIGSENGAPSATLGGPVRGSFSTGTQSSYGSGDLTVDLINGRMLSGRVMFTNQVDMPMPRVNPTLVLRLPGAVLDTTGLTIDGRGAVVLDGGNIDATFDRLLINPLDFTVTRGRAHFDAPFALRAAISDTTLSWQAVALGAAAGSQPALRIDLPAGVTLDSTGLAANGGAAAALLYKQLAITSAVATYSDDFAIRLSPFQVGSGSVEIADGPQRLATIDATGFHADIALANGGIPDHLGLPDAAIAYIDISKGPNGRPVELQYGPDGSVHIKSLPDRTTNLVLPGLGGSSPLTIPITVDFILDGTGKRIRDGGYTVMLPSPLDLTSRGIAFMLDAVGNTSDDPGNLRLLGRPILFGAPRGNTASAMLAMDASGKATGHASVATKDVVILAPGARRFAFVLDSVVVDAEATLMNAAGTYSYDAFGALDLQVAGADGYRAAAVINVSPAGVIVSSLEEHGAATATAAQLGAVSVALDAVRVDHLSYGNAGWDFSLDVDAKIGYAALPGLDLPVVEHLQLTKTGLSIPAVTVPELKANASKQNRFQLQPVALRAKAGVVDWFGGTPAAPWDLAVDVELSMPDAPGDLRSARLTFLNAKLVGNHFVGKAEPLTLAQPATLLIGKSNAGIRVTGMSGTLGDSSMISLRGEVIPAVTTGCGTGNLPDDFITVTSRGDVRGKGAASFNCGFNWRPLTIVAPSPVLTFGGTVDAPTLSLAGDATAKLPAPAGGIAEASGRIAIDLATLTLLPETKFVFTTPFVVSADPVSRMVQFLGSSATIANDGLTLTGAGSAQLSTGDKLGSVTYNNFRLTLPTLEFGGGSVAFGDPLTLGAAIGESGVLSWQVRAPDGWDASGNDQLNVVLKGAVLTREAGLTATSAGSGRVKFQQRETNADVAIANDTRFQFNPAQLTAGKIDYALNGVAVGSADRNGFTAGTLLKASPLPKLLALPSTSIAYLRVRDDNNNMLVEALPIGNDVTIRGKNGDPVDIYLPALKLTAPVQANVDIVVDAKTFLIKSGAIDILPASMKTADEKLELKRLLYSDEGSGYKWQVTARALLPATMKGINVLFNGLVLADGGIVGTATAGSYSDSYSNTQPIGTVKSGAVSVEVVGARASFSNGAAEVKLSGALRTPLFAAERGNANTQAPLAFTATLANKTLAFEIDPAKLPVSPLPVLASTFTPAAVGSGVALSAIANDTKITLISNGVLRMPKLSQDFAITLSDLTAGTDGVSVASTGSLNQSFTLFGAQFTSKPASQQQSFVSFDDDRLTLRLNGDVQFLGGKGQFRELNLAVDGVVQDNSNMLRDTLVVNKALSIAKLTIIGGRMNSSFAVTLPAPFATSNEQFDTTTLTVGIDGTQANKTITLRNEQPGMRTSAHNVLIRQATVHARAVRLSIPKLDGDGLAIQAIADVYLQNKSINRVRIGSDENGVFNPGMVIDQHGVPSWQNFMLRDTVHFDVKKIIELDIDGVTVPRADSFEIGLMGRLALAVGTGATDNTKRGKESGTVSGLGLSFRDVYMTNNHLDMTDASVDGGTLSLMDGALIIDVARFAYSDKPTTIKVANSQKNPGTGFGTADSATIAVSEFVTFGGQICIGSGGTVRRQSSNQCVLSGGVDRIMFYEDAATGHATFFMRNANLSVKDKIALNLDFRFQETDNGGFGLAFAGTGQLGGVSAARLTVAGFVETGTDFRVGAFMAFPTAIQLGPVTVTQVGGGFFWNPRQEHIDMLRNNAMGSAVGQSKFTLSTEPAAFAIFLFGQATIVSTQIANGRALLTATDAQFRLDAYVNVLNQPKNMYGTVALVVGFRRGYVEGTIDLTVIQPAIMRSRANLAFFAYSSTSPGVPAWGILGHSTTDIFPATSAGSSVSLGFTSESDLFIGPKGFVATFENNRSFSLVKLITVSGGIKGMLWYYSPKSEWGAYAALGVSASVLFGAVSASGTIEGALVGNTSSLPTIYAAGTLSVSVFMVGSWSGSVWASLGGSGFDGGFGSNDGMEKALATAQKIRNDMENSKKDVTAALATAQTASLNISLSAQDYLTAFVGLKQLATGNNGVFSQIDGLVFNEKVAMRSASALDQAGVDFFDSYIGILRGDGMPTADTAKVQALVQTADKRWTETRQKTSKADASVKSIQITVQETKAASIPPLGDSPVKAAVFSAPVADLQVQNGDTVKVLTGGPAFDLDEAAAAAAARTAQSYSIAFSAASDAILAQAKSVDESLTKVQTAMNGSESGVQGVLASFGEARKATAQAFVEQLDYLGGALDWTRSRKAKVAASEGYYPQMLNTVRRSFEAAQNTVGPDGQRTLTAGGLIVTALVLNANKTRVELLSRVLNQPSILNDYMKAAPSGFSLIAPLDPKLVTAVSQSYFDTGYNIFWDIPWRGLTDAENNLQTRIAAVRDTMHRKMAPIESAQLNLSSAVDGIYNAEAELAGLAYDLYDRYAQNAPDGDAKTAAIARRDALQKGLLAPTMQPVKVAVTTRGSTAQIDYTWSASHPTAVTEYLFRDEADAPKTTDPFYSNGGSGSLSLTRAQLDEPDSKKTTVTRTFAASARGGYGVRAFQSASYTITYAAATSTGTKTVEVTNDRTKDTSAPPAPVVTIEGANTHNGSLWVWPVVRIRARWASDDRESGISSYSVAIGKTPGADDIKPWQNMNGRTEQIYDNLELSGVKQFYVSAKATNGNGIVGPVGSSPALVLDSTAAVIGAFTIPAVVAASASTAPIATSQSCLASNSPPPGSAWTGRLTGPESVPVVTTRKLDLPAVTEDESGVRAVYWRVGKTASVFDGAQGWYLVQPGQTSVNVTSTSADDYNNMVLSVATVNYAELKSTRSANYKHADTTPPGAIGFCATMTPSNLKLIFSQAATDPESGIAGYQYRLLRTNYANKDWRKDGVDFADWNRGELNVAASYALGQYYVEMRALNKNGGAGAVTRSGPIYVDTTAPFNASPVVTSTPSERHYIVRGTSATARRDTVWGRVVGATVTATLNATPDPDSGTPVVEYAVVPGNPRSKTIDPPRSWKQVNTGTTVTLISASSGLTTPDTWYLWLRTTNGAGLKSPAEYRRISWPPQIKVEGQ